MATHSSVLPGESQGRWSLMGCRLRGRKESDTTESTQQQQQHIVLHSGCTSLHFHQKCKRTPVLPQPHQHLLLLVFLIIAILTGVRQYLTVVLICVPLMISDVEHFFLFFSAICLSSLEKCLLRSSNFQSCCLFLDIDFFTYGWVHSIIVIFGFPSFCVCVSLQAFFCDYHEVHTYKPMSIAVYFKLIVIQV